MGETESSLGNPIAKTILEAAYADAALATLGHHLKHFLVTQNVLNKLIFNLRNVSY